MHGVVILDARGRIVWTSYVAPEIEGDVRGLPAWSWSEPRDQQIIRDGYARALFDGQPAEYTIGVGRGKFRCKAEHIPDATFVARWQSIDRHVRLTQRESQVLLALCDDEPIKVTAKRLGVSTKTVEAFRATLKRKLNCKGNSALVRWAIDTGFIE